jgi:SprT protein
MHWLFYAMQTTQLSTILQKHIPAPAAPLIAMWLTSYKVHLTIKRERATKLGDYRLPKPGQQHRITINHTLNPFAFLLTLVHELAHLVAFEKHGRNIMAHGPQWKTCFALLMDPVFALNVFPPDVDFAIKKYIGNIKAGSCSDIHLSRVLNNHNAQPKTLVEQLSTSQIFSLGDARQFQIKRKLRKNFLCKEMISGIEYLVSPIAEVKKIIEN